MTLQLEMPERGIATQQFEIERMDALAPERGGRLGGISLGAPLWRARWTLSRSLRRDMSDEWRAWFLRLRGSQRAFLAVDRDRLFPRACPQGFSTMTKTDGTPFTGAAASWSQTIDADGEATLALTGLPAGLVLGRGDYVGFRWDAAGSPVGTFDRRALVRCVESVPVRVAGDGTVSLLVEMPVPADTYPGGVVPAAAEAHLDRPACLMRMVPNEGELGALDRRQKISGGTVSALQDLRA